MGDPAFGDRLEKLAYNALPATFSPDMWSHQYDQQVNQVECSINKNRNWTTNGAESNIFGLEPNYGCCTANFSQGWPKIASHLWMSTQDNGLAAAVYAPCQIKTEINGSPVQIDVITDYPFREQITLEVTAKKKTKFPLYLRIPHWADTASIRFQGEQKILPAAGKFHRIEREWSGVTKVHMTFPMKPRTSRHHNNSIVLERGPLIYSLKIGEEWKRVNMDKPHRELPHADWEVYPTTPWNYALDLNPANLKFEEHPVGKLPFSPDGAPVSVTVYGARVDSWKRVNGSAGEIPKSSVQAAGKLEKLTLIPYGCTNLRITEFPTLK
jgi:DUF1680 family protein